MKQKIKAAVKLFLVTYVILFSLMIITVPFHESLHWMLSMAQGEQIIGFHLFDGNAFSMGRIGYIMTVGKGPGLPIIFEEAVVVSIQLAVVSIASIVLIMEINRKYIKYPGDEKHEFTK